MERKYCFECVHFEKKSWQYPCNACLVHNNKYSREQWMARTERQPDTLMFREKKTEDDFSDLLSVM